MWLKFEKKIWKIVRVMVRAVLKKCVSRKTRSKFQAVVFIAQVAVWETPDTPREKREIKQKFFFSCMKPFASYSRRFKLNFKQKKRFSEKFTLVLPLKTHMSSEQFINSLENKKKKLAQQFLCKEPTAFDVWYVSVNTRRSPKSSSLALDHYLDG